MSERGIEFRETLITRRLHCYFGKTTLFQFRVVFSISIYSYRFDQPQGRGLKEEQEVNIVGTIFKLLNCVPASRSHCRPGHCSMWPDPYCFSSAMVDCWYKFMSNCPSDKRTAVEKQLLLNYLISPWKLLLRHDNSIPTTRGRRTLEV